MDKISIDTACSGWDNNEYNLWKAIRMLEEALNKLIDEITALKGNE